MQVFFLIALGFALLGIMFALQNIVPVRVAFLTWTFEGSLALVLFVALIVGALVSSLVSIPTILKGRWAVNGLKKQITQLEAELADSKRAHSTAMSASALGAGSVVSPSARS
jgi:uncharacterized integral membrane protein